MRAEEAVKRSEQGEENSPQAPAMPDDVQNDVRRPGSVGNERADETDALRRDRPPGGPLDLPEASKVESVQDRGSIVEGAEYRP